MSFDFTPLGDGFDQIRSKALGQGLLILWDIFGQEFGANKVLQLLAPRPLGPVDVFLLLALLTPGSLLLPELLLSLSVLCLLRDRDVLADPRQILSGL